MDLSPPQLDMLHEGFKQLNSSGDESKKRSESGSVPARTPRKRGEIR